MKLHDALEWYLNSDNSQQDSSLPSPPAVLVVEREAILEEIQALSAAGSGDAAAVMKEKWTSFCFQSLYASRTAFNKAQQQPKFKTVFTNSEGVVHVQQQVNVISAVPSGDTYAAEIHFPIPDFSSPGLEKFVNKDMFIATAASPAEQAQNFVPSLKMVETSVSTLKDGYCEWIAERKESICTEIGCKFTENIEWMPISLRNNELMDDHRMHRQLMRTIAMGKKGFSLSRNDVSHLQALLIDVESNATSFDADGLLLLDDLDLLKESINAQLTEAGAKYRSRSAEMSDRIWSPVFGIIDFIQNKIRKLDTIVGEDTINNALESLCTSHGMDVFLPFEMYWHPIEQILKRKYKATPNDPNLEAEVNAALAKYFRFYRDVTDGSSGIPALLKKSVSSLMDFIREFMVEYADVLKTINVPNRPDVTDKIVKESMLSFEGLTKVTEGRVKEMTLDMSERKANILDEIVEFIDFLATSSTPSENRIERLAKRDTRKRFTHLDRKFLNLVKSTKTHLIHSFPSLHLALIGYMMVKFFVYEKTYEESRMLTELLSEKVRETSHVLKKRDDTLKRYQRGVEMGMFELSKIFGKIFSKKLLEKYDEHLLAVRAEEEQKLLAARMADLKTESDPASSKENIIPAEKVNLSAVEQTLSKSKKKSKKKKTAVVDQSFAEPSADDGKQVQTDFNFTEFMHEFDSVKSQLQTYQTRVEGLLDKLSRTEKERDLFNATCNTYKSRIVELEKELSHVKNNISPPPSLIQPSLTPMSPSPPPMRQHALFGGQLLSNHTARPNLTPIGSHLRQNNNFSQSLGVGTVGRSHQGNSSSPQLFSPWM